MAKTQIIVQPRPKERGIAHEEAKLQARMVMKFAEIWPHLRGHLFATFQEVSSGVEGSMKLSMGLVRGVSDLIYCDEGSLIGIEVKCPGTRHKVAHLIEQAEWLIRVPKWGYFCDDLDDFLNIIDGGVGGIDPVKVLEYCKKAKTQQILWDKSLFI